MEIIFFLIGSFVLFLGAYLIFDHIRYVRIALETTGKVTGFKVKEGSKGNKTYQPVVESYFGDFTGRYGSGRPQYQIGETVEVIYISGKTPRLKSNMPYFVGVFLMVFGGIFCSVFLAMFNFSIWNVLYSLGVFVLIALSFRRVLKSKGIDSVDEFTEVLKSNQKEEIDEKEIIREPARMQEVSTNQKGDLKIIGPIFTLVGLGVVALGIYLGVERYHFLETAVPASGVVVDLEERSSDDGYTYYPIVEYSPAGTFKAIRFTHDVGSSPPSYRRGEHVEVLHQPDNPNEAIIDKGIFNWAISIFVILFGLLFASAGVGASISAFRRKRKLKSV
ncbi:MAG: hypothetical protein CL670_08175 [Balneola sp.]|jgi:hypothetical protein|nr:hypothetical protein [Balneola sp.]MBE79113.1 hypothetical protein [Balneola sp.]|tara:strand:+ start:2212 stop:3210 length:999 start_codon:yes stop_codon:yes gene_type:complete